MIFETFAPIGHLPIIWTCLAFHLDIALNSRFAVRPEFPSIGSSKHPISGLILMPVLAAYPAYSSGWMLVFGPLHQLKEEDVIAFVKDLCCYGGLVVVRPSFGQWGDRSDQFLLREASSCSHMFLHFLDMPVDSFLAGCDDGFEAKLFSIRILARSVFSNGVLSDRKAQKIEADFSMVWREGMGNLGFAWFQFQAHAV